MSGAAGTRSSEATANTVRRFMPRKAQTAGRLAHAARSGGQPSSFSGIRRGAGCAVAAELVRVCRPGGVIGMINLTPDGIGGEFFAFLAPYAPAPPGPDLPVAWGQEEHVRGLFGTAVSDLTMTRQTYVERAASGEEYCTLFRETFGPLIVIRDSLAPARRAELDRAFLESVVKWNKGRSTGAVEIPYEYLLVIARTAARSPRPR
jgi:hypothetical protein